MNTKIQRIAVIGAGTMGRGIAYVAAVGGFDTRLHDVSKEMLEKASSYFMRTLEKEIASGKIDAATAEQAKELFRTASELDEAVDGCDLVIEAIPEKIDMKVELFGRLGQLCPPGTLFASNTSSLSITEMAAVTSQPRNFAGMHFFNPVPVMRLVEIVRGLETSDETIAVIQDVAGRMGKETVVVRESPGFVTSRINALIGNEAFYMLQEGVASAEDIDKALKLGLNHPMGPFEMVDMVGLDVRLGVLEFLHRTLGEKYRPAPLLVQYVKAGRLGRKTGQGVYTYDAE
jgi:3-hydroxybutyryl-CoA dehydrogenase